MGREIERKFLIADDAWRSMSEGTDYCQGYLNSAKDRVVRVRTMGSRAVLTIKGAGTGITRPEFEYDIPMEDAEELFELCEQPLIEKTRFKITYKGLIWEVDEFKGANLGLIVAECELESEEQVVAKPDWVGMEVTGDSRYFNSNLVAKPYSRW